MSTAFSIDTDNNITAFAATEQITEGQDQFASQKELAKLSAAWPIARFVEVWNAFAGVPPFGALKPVKKFTDRKTAVTRIWTVIQKLDEGISRASIRETEAKLKATRARTPTPAQHATPVAPKKAKATKEATAKEAAPTAREGSKKAHVLELLRRPEGATIANIQAATGWQAHSVRGFISGGLGKKMGLKVESLKTPEGERTYRIGGQTA
jgi:hypothetical protein